MLSLGEIRLVNMEEEERDMVRPVPVKVDHSGAHLLRAHSPGWLLRGKI